MTKEGVIVSAADIDATQFEEALGRYAALIKDLTKSPKPGSLTLEELDYFRYVEAPSKFSIKGAKLGLKDLQKLVDWKLRHGTFRPTLPKLVASNSEASVNSITEEGFSIYENDHSELAAAVKKLSDLKGIGPATASLLLAVYDPHKVVFFSDEVYKWLLPEADKPKYTPKEFDNLFARSRPLMDRLNVKAVDIEKVAYVLVKEAEPKFEPKVKPIPSGRPRGRPAKSDGEKKQKADPVKPSRPRRTPAKDKPTEPPAMPKVEIPPTKKRGRPVGSRKECASEVSSTKKSDVKAEDKGDIEVDKEADDILDRSSKRSRLSAVF